MSRKACINFQAKTQKAAPFRAAFFMWCQPVSRVLSCSVIYLGLALLPSSSNLPSLTPFSQRYGSGQPHNQGIFGLSTRKVCRAFHVAMEAVGSYPAVSPFPLLKNQKG